MVKISEDDRKKYPDPNGGYYTKRYDTDNVRYYKDFFEAMVDIKSNLEDKKTMDSVMERKPKLPKLKKGKYSIIVEAKDLNTERNDIVIYDFK